MDFLQKPLEWFSSFYIRVQSKICGRKIFFSFFLSEFFRILSENFFQTFGRKTSRICQNYLLRVQRNNLWLKKYFKSFKSFWIFCRNLWHGSQVSVYVSRVKFAEETVFWFFLFRVFFRILSKNFFRLSAKNLQKVVKTTFCMTRGTIYLLKYFLNFWIVLDFLQKPLALFSSFYIRVQSKICGRKIFFSFFLSEFFRILSESFFRLLAE